MNTTENMWLWSKNPTLQRDAAKLIQEAGGEEVFLRRMGCTDPSEDSTSRYRVDRATRHRMPRRTREQVEPQLPQIGRMVANIAAGGEVTVDEYRLLSAPHWIENLEGRLLPHEIPAVLQAPIGAEIETLKRHRDDGNLSIDEIMPAALELAKQSQWVKTLQSVVERAGQHCNSFSQAGYPVASSSCDSPPRGRAPS